MHLPPLIALLAWIPLAALLFRFCVLRVAILANFLAGWALLPGANYVSTPFGFPYWILPVCLPSNYFITKASILGFAAICGVLLFHRNEFRSFRVRRSDIPIAVWCLFPLLSDVANHLGFWEGCRDVAYLSLAWAVPYALGRHCFSDRQSLLLAAKAIVVAGMLYVPVCLLEFLKGPQLCAHIYGYQPYRWIGAKRYVGFRPVGFLEDGNQLGIWMASSALLAMALWVRGLMNRVLRLPMKWTAAILIALTLLCQSVGAILLLAVLLPFTLLARRRFLRIGIVVFLCGLAVCASLQLTVVIPWREIAQTNPIARSIAGELKRVGRRSLGWRLVRDESQLPTAMQKPFLGSGEWNWWRNGGERPWDLWLLIFGIFGAIAVLALTCTFAAPIVRAVWFVSPGEAPHTSFLSVALAGLILMSVLDSLLNGAIILPYMIIVGGLSANASADSSFRPSGDRR